MCTGFGGEEGRENERKRDRNGERERKDIHVSGEGRQRRREGEVQLYHCIHFFSVFLPVILRRC